ncbi:MAG: S53 family peptidase [Actinomycetota bacterium]
MTIAAAMLLFASAALPAAGSPGRVSLGASRAPYARPGDFVRPAGAGEIVDFQLYLGLRDRGAAEALLASVSDPSSSDYGRYLTPEQFRSRFSPSDAAVAAARSWLEAEGFSVGAVPANHLVVPARGTVREVERAFGVHLNHYRVNGVVLRAPSSAPSIPASLSGIVHGVLGLAQSFVHRASVPPAPPPPAYRVAKPCSAYWAEKIATDQPPAYGQSQPYAPCGYTPAQLQGAYGTAEAIAVGNDGSGVTVAIIDAYASPTIQQDLDAYSARYGLPQLTIQQITVPIRRGSVANQQGWYGEETLDIEAVHSMAPGASILYWGAASNSNNDMRDSMIDIVDNARAQIVSNSYGNWGEQLPPVAIKADDDVYIQAGVEGIGLYFSSGDYGDEIAALGYRTVDWPASSTHVTAVGGTSLAVGAQNDYLFETGWGSASSSRIRNHWDPPIPGEYVYGSGGGTSFIFDTPSYQLGVVPTQLSGFWGRSNRVVPDISAVGDPNTGFVVGQTQVFPNGDVRYAEYRVGGTSLSCPLIAGIMALADQGAGAAHGFANPALYALARTSAVRDIVNPASTVAVVRPNYVNGVSAKDGIYYVLRTMNFTGSLHTIPGYDDVTGIGSPNGEAFLTALS